MLKGVNRQVLEISQPENKYFERILFFVRPEYSSLPETRLKQQAAHALPEEAKPPLPEKHRRLRPAELLRAAVCAGAGAGLLALAEMILGK